MLPNALSKLGLGLTSFAIWALAAGSIAFWGLKISAKALPAQAAPVSQESTAGVDTAAVGKVLGAVRQDTPVVAAAAPASSRYTLVGVGAASAAHQRGVALIAIDGKPARPYRVGAQLEEGVLLQSVEARKAVLAAGLDGPALATLELPLKK